MSAGTALATYKTFTEADFTRYDTSADRSLIALAASSDNERTAKALSYSVALSLCPVAFPPNWVHIKILARGIGYDNSTDIVALRARIYEKLIDERERTPDSEHNVLTYRGYLASLGALENIIALYVDYEEPTPEARAASYALFAALSPDSAVLPGVDYVHAALATRPALLHPRGLHSELIFEPSSAGACACGRYLDRYTRPACKKCGAAVSGVSPRPPTSSLIAIPGVFRRSFVNPATSQALPYVPVIPTLFRSPSLERGRWTFCIFDRIYTRILVTFALAASSSDPGQLQLLRALAASDISQLCTTTT